MNILALGLGDSGWEDPAGEAVLRHQEYARRAGGSFDLIVDSTRRQVFQHGELTVHLTGSPRSQYVFATRSLAARIARKRMPDIVTSQDPFGTAFAGWLIRNDLKRPLLIQNHSAFLFNPYWLAERPFYFRLLHLLARFILPRADGWRVVNGMEKQKYIDRLGLPADPIRILPVPCDLEPFLNSVLKSRASQTRAKWGIPADAFLVLWAGRPVRVKRIPILLEAFARVQAEIPDVYLVLAGDKTLAQENLGSMAEQVGVSGNCLWTGALPRSELAALFAAADVFLMTSAYEGFGRVLVEAGAAGLPVVSTATAGAVEIIRAGETGFLVPVDDAEALADQTIHLWKDPGLRAKLSRIARETVPARFDPDQAFDGIVAQWRDMAAQGRAT